MIFIGEDKTILKTTLDEELFNVAICYTTLTKKFEEDEDGLKAYIHEQIEKYITIAQNSWIKKKRAGD